jgi:hypothetical protein
MFSREYEKSSSMLARVPKRILSPYTNFWKRPLGQGAFVSYSKFSYSIIGKERFVKVKMKVRLACEAMVFS